MISVKNREGFLVAVEAELMGMTTCVEIGVYKGEFSKMIFDILQPNMLYLVDPFDGKGTKQYPDGMPTAYSTIADYNKVSELFQEEIRSGEVHIIKDFSYNAFKYFPKNFFDFVYIDGSHLYEDVKLDLITYSSKLTEDSLLCGHDYASSFDGVKTAVDVFCKEHGFKMIIYNENGGDYALKRI